MRDPDTPRTVEVEASARAPEEDPTLEVEVEPDRTGPAQHRLVTIGDSLTHGFQSGAIFNTDLSYRRSSPMSSVGTISFGDRATRGSVGCR